MDLLNPIAANCDPATSHIAAEDQTRSGKRDRHAKIVLAMVRSNPGQTACELWELATAADRAELHEMQRVRQRLSDMNGVNVVQGPSKICTVRGTRQMTWFPIDRQETLFG